MTAFSRNEPTRSAIEARLTLLASALDAHAGGVELRDLSTDGVVSLRFTGMCTGCPLRPVTLNGVVKPALMTIDGVNAVQAEGGRLSREAEERLGRQLALYGSGCVLDAVEGGGGVS